MNVDLADYENELSSVCAIYGVKHLELFGSASRDDFSLEESDLDFLVAFEDNHPLGAFDRYFGLKEDLERLFRRPVDLVEVRAIKNPYFRQAVEEDKVLVYETGN